MHRPESAVIERLGSANPAHSHRRVWAVLLPWIIVAVGLGIRTAQYASNRSLWADEAKLALNILNRSYLGLLQPLDYDQVAPPGFLWAEKLTTQLFGPSDYALRLIPFIASVAALILFYRLAQVIFWGTPTPLFLEPIRPFKGQAIAPPIATPSEPPAAMPHPLLAMLSALLLFACSSDLTYYGSEVKQYSSDVAIALLLTLLLLWIRRPPLTPRQVAIATGVGAIALWFSHPAVFVLAGLELTFWLRLGGHWRQIRQTPGLLHRLFTARLLIYGGWLLSFAALYGLTLYNHPSTDTLSQSWDYTFPESWADLDWAFDALKRFFRNPLRFPDGIDEVAIATVIVGIIGLTRHRPDGLGLLLTPVLMTLGASYVQQYPFRDRLVLFLVPFFILLLAAGIGYWWHCLRIRVGRVPLGAGLSVVLTGLILSLPLWQAGQTLMKPQAFEDTRILLAYVQAHRQPGDRLYVFQKSQFQVAYYAPRYGLDAEDYDISIDPDTVADREFSQEEKRAYRADLDQLKGESRVWVLVADTSLRDDTQFMLDYLDSLGQRRDSLDTRYPASFVYLYDLS